jgi:3-hydroxyacyl-[acyl-carrier-protein] dehydratase
LRELPWDIQQIQEILPHRYPMLLVDRVLEIEPEKRIVALKNVTANEQVFLGHFPGQPVYPGVLLIEGMAQAGGILLMTGKTDEERKKLLTYFTSIDRARFRRPVVPGDQVLYEAEVLRLRSNYAKLSAKALVDGELAAEATVSVATVKQ